MKVRKNDIDIIVLKNGEPCFSFDFLLEFRNSAGWHSTFYQQYAHHSIWLGALFLTLNAQRMKLLRFELTALQHIYHYLQEHPTERLSIDRLMEISRMNETKLTKGFKQVYSESIYQHQLKGWLPVFLFSLLSRDQRPYA